MSRPDFEKVLLEAIDEGLASLGESSKQAVYFHLEKSFDIEKQEIPYKITDFADALEKIFGIGANFLEILIMKRLFEKVERSIKWQRSKDFTFTEYVIAAKRSFEEKSEAKKKTKGEIQCDQIVIESK